MLAVRPFFSRLLPLPYKILGIPGCGIDLHSQHPKGSGWRRRPSTDPGILQRPSQSLSPSPIARPPSMLLSPLTYKPQSPPRRSRQEPTPAPEHRSPTREARPATGTQPQGQVTADLATLAPLTYKPESATRRSTREPATVLVPRSPTKKSGNPSVPEPQPRVTADVGTLAPLTYKPESNARGQRREPTAAPTPRSPRPETGAATETQLERPPAGPELQSLAPLTYKPQTPAPRSRKESVVATEARSPQKAAGTAGETQAQRKELQAEIGPLAPLTYKPASPPPRLRKEHRTVSETRAQQQEVRAETETRPRQQDVRAATGTRSPRKQSVVAPEPPSPRRQPWSATEARFPRQHIATPTEARFPRHRSDTPTESRFPRKETRAAVVAQSHRQEARTSAVPGSLPQDARASAFPAPARQDARISAQSGSLRHDVSSAVPVTRTRNTSALRLDIPRNPLPISRFSPGSRSGSPSTPCASGSTTPVSAVQPSRSNDALSRSTRRQASPDSAISLGSVASAGGRMESQHQHYERSSMLKSASCHTLRSAFNELEPGRTRRGTGESTMVTEQPSIHVTGTAPRAATHGHDRTGAEDNGSEARRVVSEEARVVRPPSWFPALKKAVSMEGPRLYLGGRFMQCDIIEEGQGHKDTDAHSIRITKSVNNLGQAERTINHRLRTSDGRHPHIGRIDHQSRPSEGRERMIEYRPPTSDGRSAAAAERKDSMDRVGARGRGSGNGSESRGNQSPPSRSTENPACRRRPVDPEERGKRGRSWLDL